MIKNFLHKLGFHSWKYLFETFRICRICKRREKLEITGQPGVGITRIWLEFSDERE